MNIQQHTLAVVLRLTQKRWPILLYSEPVTSFHSAMAKLFFRRTHPQTFVSCFSIACLLLRQICFLGRSKVLHPLSVCEVDNHISPLGSSVECQNRCAYNFTNGRSSEIEPFSAPTACRWALSTLSFQRLLLGEF